MGKHIVMESQPEISTETQFIANWKSSFQPAGNIHRYSGLKRTSEYLEQGTFKGKLYHGILLGSSSCRERFCFSKQFNRSYDKQLAGGGGLHKQAVYQKPVKLAGASLPQVPRIELNNFPWDSTSRRSNSS